jgi:hypothetical protein
MVTRTGGAFAPAELVGLRSRGERGGVRRYFFEDQAQKWRRATEKALDREARQIIRTRPA